MIEKTIGYKTSRKDSEGKVAETFHDTIQGAQRHEIAVLLSLQRPSTMDEAESFAEPIVRNAHAIIDILTTGPKSRPKARAVNGAKKTRKPRIIPELAAAILAHETK